MNWYRVAAAGATRDLWVHVTGDTAPQYGRWKSPSGLDVTEILDRKGPSTLDVDVWWVQQEGHRGRRLTDMLWDTGLLGIKLLSERMHRVLIEQGATLETFDADIRLSNGDRVEGYVAVLEESEQPGPVHSLWHGRRSHDVVVSDPVRKAMDEARLTGLEIEPVVGPFPADTPGFFDDAD